MPVKIMLAPANIRITCKACNKSGYASDFTSCNKEECQLMGRKSKNQKPAAILTSGKVPHHYRCNCVDCLDKDAAKLEAVLLQAGAAPTNQKSPRMRVRHFESAVMDDDYDKKEELRYVECPKAVCTQIITLGKK